MRSIPAGIEGPRTDYSRFLVHLTRDDSGDDENGDTAFANFRHIWDQQTILAVRPHCLHHKKVEQLDTKQQQYFKVACFTETPLDQIHHLTKDIVGRSHNLEPFGFVFEKETLIDAGAQQAVYINCYNGINDVRKGYDRIFHYAKRTGFQGESWRILPYINVVQGSYDFAWEKEWRLNQDFEFDLDDLVCVIMPDERYGPMKYTLHKLGVAVISPGWTYEHIVRELSSQKRRTRSIVKSLNKSVARKP